MSESSSDSTSSPISWDFSGSSLEAKNASPPPESNSSPPSVSPPPDSESSPPSSAPPIAPKVPPPSSSTPSTPAPTSIGSNSPPPNQSTSIPPPKIAASPPSPSSSAPPPSSPLHGPTSPPSKSSPPPNLPPDSKATPPPRVVTPPTPKTPQGSPPSPPLPRGPPSPSTPDTSPSTEIMSPKPSPSTPSDVKQVNNAAHRASRSSPTTSSSPPSSSVIASGAGTAIGISAAMLVVALVAMLFIILRKKKKKRGIHGFVGHYKPTPDAGGHAARKGIHHASNSPSSPTTGKPYGGYMGHGYHAGTQEPGGSRSWFTYEELTDVTNGFSHKNIIGEGGFGCVYKGNLPDGRQVAVKQLKVGSGQGEREFRAEVEIISRIHHRHLVSLVGYCICEQQRLLVYEFIPNKTLEYHLHENRLPVLDWTKRMKIAIGSARGLAYLHEDCHPRIIHRDIKSANILVDDSFEAKVADFGLAKLSNDTNTHVSTRVMGTFGYMAPEYASSGKLTDRSDVFSFGVVLLELITGRKPIDPSQPLGDESLVEWARPLLVHVLETGEYEELADPRLENNFAKSEMLKMIEAAAACVRHSATKRPRMVQVLRALDSEGNLVDLSNGVKFGQSTVYDSGQYSTDIEKFRKMALESDIYGS